MSSIVKVTESAALQRNDDLTRDQVELIKRTICRGATDDELDLFVQTCNRLRLDPFARQIFAVKRWDSRERREVMSIQVSIDGFRLTAERTGEYQGQTPPQWCGPDGVWRDVWLDRKPPSAARIGVMRRGFVEPLYRVARFDSYAQTKKDGGLTQMWANMPDVMIAKCAEALALRAAFPADLSGVYTDDEMQQADAPPPRVRVEPTQPRALPQPESEPDDAVYADDAPPDAVDDADIGDLRRDVYALATSREPLEVKGRMMASIRERATTLGVSTDVLNEWRTEAKREMEMEAAQ